MITIKIKGPNCEEGGCRHGEEEFAMIKPRIWIGRGEDVAEKEGLHSHALNLASYSKAVSRIHACLLFSPAFFHSEWRATPTYLTKLVHRWSAVGEKALALIWEFARPAKRVLLKDLQSKAGIFRKLESERLSAGMTIVLGDSRPIMVHNREIYDSPYAFTMRLEQLVQQGHAVLNPPEGDSLPISFWILSYRSNSYILLDQPSQRIVIGRSSECHLVVPEPAISRRHASLHFQKGEWVLLDGDGSQASSNGVWVKSRRIWMGFEGRAGEGRGESRCKVGDILLSFGIREEHSLLHISQCVSFNRSTDGSFQELRKEEMEEGPSLEKHRSQL